MNEITEQMESSEPIPETTINDNSSETVESSSETIMESTDNSFTEILKENESNIVINVNLSYMKSVQPKFSEEQLKDIASVKFVGPDRIFHYAFLWGNEDHPDLTAEYFTKESDLWDTILKKSARPLTWDHAQDPTFKSNPVIGKTLDYGDDDIGRWALSVLDNSHTYYRAISDLISKGIIGTSSDSAPQYVEKEKRGKAMWLKTWPWFASALTATPCEPRMVGTVDFFKTLGVILPSPEVPDLQVRAAKRKAKALFKYSEIFGDIK